MSTITRITRRQNAFLEPELELLDFKNDLYESYRYSKSIIEI